ncbi:hypothetical protein QP245_25565, partial [Klebsiella pneumoniae]|nr:hypothetical protein [Klebsiella pneumoniae]
ALPIITRKFGLHWRYNDCEKLHTFHTRKNQGYTVAKTLLNLSQAAQAAGITRRTLYNHVKQGKGHCCK